MRDGEWGLKLAENLDRGLAAAKCRPEEAGEEHLGSMRDSKAFARVDGFDGAPGIGKVTRRARKTPIDEELGCADVVLSLEVFEHIPAHVRVDASEQSESTRMGLILTWSEHTGGKVTSRAAGKLRRAAIKGLRLRALVTATHNRCQGPSWLKRTVARSIWGWRMRAG